jgi:hypothetical protein
MAGGGVLGNPQVQQAAQNYGQPQQPGFSPNFNPAGADAGPRPFESPYQIQPMQSQQGGYNPQLEAFNQMYQGQQPQLYQGPPQMPQYGQQEPQRGRPDRNLQPISLQMFQGQGLPGLMNRR